MKGSQFHSVKTDQYLLSRVNPQHGQARPGTLLVNCKHIFEQDKQPSYVSVLVLLLSLRYYISLWNPIGS